MHWQRRAEEDLLIAFSKRNWIVVRPYLTYNSERLQLGGIFHIVGARTQNGNI